MLDPESVTEVWAPAGASGTFGSGYLLSNALVLTAGHVVDAASGAECWVRPLGTDQWLPAERVWRGEACDAALLRVRGCEPGEADRVEFGRFATWNRARGRAVGFPRAQQAHERRRQVRDTEEIAGEVAPLSSLKAPRLIVHIEGSVPSPGPEGHSPWEGVSGAALFSGPLLVGLLNVDPACFGTDRLEAVPVTEMVAERNFAAALSEDPGRKIVLAAVEDVEAVRDVLRVPYRPVPATSAVRRAPSFLLRPDFGIVPFRGRVDEISTFSDWCDGDPDLAVALLVGEGGSGKSRLARELCRRRRAEGALAGFLERDPSSDRLRALNDVTATLLVVVDDAQGRREHIAELLAQLASRTPRMSPARVLLVARQAGNWWETLPERLRDAPNAELTLATATVRELQPLEPTAGGRDEAFLDAARAFAGFTGQSLDGLARADLSQLLFERILFVHLAALTALDGEIELMRGRVVGKDLLEALLRREADYWRDTARAAGLTLDGTVRRRAVAVATLTTAECETQAAGVLAAIPDLADASQQTLRRVARWLRDLYSSNPGAAGVVAGRATADGQEEERSWFYPLAPAVLGEALVASVVDELPTLAIELLACSTRSQTRRALTVLTVAARSYASAELALRRVLADALPSVWQTAIEVAQEAGDPLAELLVDAFEQAPQPDLAAQVVRALPPGSVALRELAVVVTRQALEHSLESGETTGAMETAGRLYGNLAVHLSQLDRYEEALVASGRAIEIDRRLADGRPETFLPRLAGVLSGRSVHLSVLGREEEALAATEEAVQISRRMADTAPGLVGLGLALHNRSTLLSAVGRREQALEASEEAVEAYRRELADAPQEPLLPGYAGALSHLAALRAELGRKQQALPASEEALEIRRRMAEARPDAFLRDLAAELTNRSNHLVGLGRPRDALAASVESVEIYRQLADARPEAFLPSLARALHTLAAPHAALGQRKKALEASEEGVEIRRRLAEADPDAFLGDLGVAVTGHAVRLASSDRRDEALAASEEAVGIYRRLADARPNVLLPTLALALNNHSNRLAEVGRHEQARAACEEAVEIYGRLAHALPDRYLAELNMALGNLQIHLDRLDRGKVEKRQLDEREKIGRNAPCWCGSGKKFKKCHGA